MKYIRTKDGRIRIVVELNEFDEKEIRKIPNDCTMVKSNNIFGCSIVENENIIKQADTIEELIQDDDLALWFKIKVYCDDYYYEYLTKDVLMSIKDAKTIASMGYSGHFNLKDIKELYIKDKRGNYIKIAERKDEKGELELLWKRYF